MLIYVLGKWQIYFRDALTTQALVLKPNTIQGKPLSRPQFKPKSVLSIQVSYSSILANALGKRGVFEILKSPYMKMSSITKRFPQERRVYYAESQAEQSVGLTDFGKYSIETTEKRKLSRKSYFHTHINQLTPDKRKISLRNNKIHYHHSKQKIYSTDHLRIWIDGKFRRRRIWNFSRKSEGQERKEKHTL